MVRRLAEFAPAARIERVRILRKGFAEPVLTRRGRGLVVGYSRRAKNVLIHLEHGWTIRIQLGMTGHVYWIPDARKLPRFTRLVFLLAEGAIAFEDSRVFGSAEIHPTASLPEVFADYGPEPLDEAFTWRDLAERAVGRSGEIKPFLLDQSRVVGLGNIWAAEALFLAGILPWRRVNTVREAEWQKLHKAIRRVLSQAIARTFRVTKGPEEFPEADLLAAAVYGREGEPCRKCKTPILRRTQAARSTFFCGECQL